MCLIITGKSKTIIDTLLNTPRLLADILQGNGDGVGAMYVTSKQKLRTPKIVTKEAQQAVDFIRQLPADERDMAIHFRMKTHGLIDTTNCHPYIVLPGQIAMMHNGVLNWINDKSDKDKSDTWHYVEQFARPMLQACPELFLIPAWQEVIEDQIGTSNRFVFMDNQGRMAVLNRHTGIEHDGLWFSNEYAWSPELLIPGYRSVFTGRGFSRDDDFDWESGGTVLTAGTADTFFEGIREDFEKAVIVEFDADEAEKLLGDYPITTLNHLMEYYWFTSHVPRDKLSTAEAEIVRLLEEGKPGPLQAHIKDSDVAVRRTAECMCWYGEWTQLDETDETQPASSLSEFEVGKTYRTRDGQQLRKVIGVNVAGELVVQPVDGSDEANAIRERNGGLLPTTTRWSNGMLFDKLGPLDLVLPAIEDTPAPGAAVVAPVKSRSVMYRGYTIEVPQHLLDSRQFLELRDYLEKEAQRLYDEELIEREARATAEAANEAYAG